MSKDTQVSITDLAAGRRTIEMTVDHLVYIEICYAIYDDTPVTITLGETTDGGDITLYPDEAKTLSRLLQEALATYASQKYEPKPGDDS